MRRTTIAIAFLCTTSVWADCPDGVYEFTDVDKKFMTDTTAALGAALPPAPDGWQMYDMYKKPVRPGAPLPAATPPNMSCRGADKVPFITGYGASYLWVTGEKDLVQKQNELRKKMAAVQRTPMAADQEKLAKELAIKDRDLRYQARKFEKTDKAEADRLKAEAAVYRKQLDEIQQAHYATLKPQLDALQKEDDALRLNTPLQVAVSIGVNSAAIDMNDLKPSNAQAGAATTLTGAKRTLLVYGGSWKKDTNGALLAVLSPGADVRKVHNIVVTAEGDPKQVEALLSKMDGAALNALVGK